MTSETTSPYTSERQHSLLSRMRSGMSVMKLAMESCEGVMLNPEMLDCLDQWIDNINELQNCASQQDGAELSA